MLNIDRITRLLRKVIQGNAPPKAWREYVASLLDEDADGDEPLQNVVLDVIGCEFIIEYIDAQEQESERRISIQEVGYFL